MARQFLDGTNVAAVFEEMRRERVAEGVQRGSLRNPGAVHGRFDDALKYRFAEMMSSELSSSTVTVRPCRGEYPLPNPLSPRIRVLARERVRKLDPAGAVPQIAPMLFTSLSEVAAQVAFDCRWQHRHPIVALGATDDNLIGGEVDVLDAEATALKQAQSGAIEERGHQARHAFQLPQDCQHFVTRQNHRQPLRAFRAHDAIEPGDLQLEHVPIEEQQCAQRLVLGGRRHVAFGCEGLRNAVSSGAPRSAG
jgi:hypothetical protein